MTAQADPQVVVRVAAPADVDAVARLERDNLGDDAWSRGLVEDAVLGALPTVHCLVAESGGRVVGHAVASVAGDVAELQRIAVDPANRRAGLASRLLAASIELAGAGGAERLLLEVREDNDGAIAFYAARGFFEIDRRPRYFRDGGTAVVMLRSLAVGDGSA